MFSKLYIKKRRNSASVPEAITSISGYGLRRIRFRKADPITGMALMMTTGNDYNVFDEGIGINTVIIVAS